MSKPTDYCVIEFDFLTGGAVQAYLSLKVSQRYAYLMAWSYAVHLRRLHLSCYEMEHRLGALYAVDQRTVNKMLHECCKHADLMIKENGGYTITGVQLKHPKLKGWKAPKTKFDGDLTGDSTVQDSTVQDSIENPDINKQEQQAAADTVNLQIT